MPVVIEDRAFIGSRCIVVGVRVEEEAVLGANVVLTGSTQIIDAGPEEVVHRPPRPLRGGGRDPHQTVPGRLLPAPERLIIGRRRASTDQKTSLNEALREFGVSV